MSPGVAGRRRRALELTQHVQTGHGRQCQVEQYNIGLVHRRACQALLPVPGLDHGVALLSEQGRHNCAGPGIIFDDRHGLLGCFVWSHSIVL
jgi:hypothetical protein